MPIPLGHGVRTTGWIYCFAYDSINNRLYAGGYFENIGGLETPSIAFYDGSQWHAMGSGLVGGVTGMKMMNGNLYVAGYFSQAGNIKVSNIAMWDGINWNAVGNTVVTTYRVMSLEVYHNELYLSAFLAMGVGAVGVAKFDGVNWSVVANSGIVNQTIRIKTINDSLFIYGGFQSLNGIPLTSIAAYDGTNFYDYNFGFYAIDLLGNKGTLYAAGPSSYYHYNGSTWIPLLTHNVNVPFLFTYRDSLYATFANNGTTTDTTEVWNITNGTKNSRLAFTYFPSSIVYDFFDAAIEVNSNIYLGGIFFNLNKKNIVASGFYDGTSWNQFAGGAISNWDQSYWDNWPNALINTLAYDSLTGDIYAGGNFCFAGDSNAANVARWDGLQWHAVGDGFNNIVSKLIFYHDTLYACGGFNYSGSTIVNGIAKWDGTAWIATGSGTTGWLYDMLVLNNKLYVAGSFTLFNGLSANNIVKYNGSAWNIVGSNNLDKRIVSMSNYNDTLVVATTSQFSNFASNIARLNGSTWSPLAATPQNSTRINLFTNNGFLYAAVKDVYKFNGANSWQSTGLPNSIGNPVNLNKINGNLNATIWGGPGMYEMAPTWNKFQNRLETYDVIQLNSSTCVIGGFIPYYFDGLKQINMYNIATLEIKKPDVSFSADHDSICSHQYVFFNAPSSTFPQTFQWLFPGGIPSTSNLQFPFVKYNVPGIYDVFFKATSNYGSDSILIPGMITVDACMAEINNADAENHILIFPNPCNDLVHFHSESLITSLQISDCVGKNLYDQTSLNINQVDINLSTFARGLYFARIQCGDKFFIQKIIRN